MSLCGVFAGELAPGWPIWAAGDDFRVPYRSNWEMSIVEESGSRQQQRVMAAARRGEESAFRELITPWQLELQRTATGCLPVRPSARTWFRRFCCVLGAVSRASRRWTALSSMEGCPSCSLLADHFDGALPHLNARDVTLLCVSRASLERLLAYRRRMGWRFPWVSSLGSDFNFDFGVSFTEEQRTAGATYNFRHMDSPLEEMPGISTFALCDGTVHHVYSAYAPGGDVLTGAYQLLDRAPLGRAEHALPWTMAWVRRHDEYQREEVA